MPLATRRARRLALAALPLATACIWVIRAPEVRRVAPVPVAVATAAKAHLRDGSVVMMPQGLVVRGDTLYPGLDARRHDSLRRGDAAARPVPLDSVIGMESYRARYDVASSVIISTLATALAAVGTAGAAVAIFGSCPTIYADSAGQPVLQAEVFANRIAPLFEARDVDRLRAAADASGRLVLEVRNEALETHYINQLGVVELRHPAGTRALVDERGHALLVGSLRPPLAARDRGGRDVLDLLRAHDARPFASSRARIAAATAADPGDFVELALPRPAGAGDSVAVVIRLRNSLLNTVLLYDEMLGAAGARALDWLGDDLARVGPAVELGRWYNGRFGLRVQVPDGAAWREVARHPTYGPIGWREVATVVAAPPGADTVRVRLAFATDEWRIEQVAVAPLLGRVDGRAIAPSAARGSDGTREAASLAALAAADEHYLSTLPGQRLYLTFDAGPAPAGDSARTFLLASQGYYVEWVRGRWARDAAPGAAPFVPGDDALVRALHRWDAARDTLERAFYATRIPVR